MTQVRGIEKLHVTRLWFDLDIDEGCYGAAAEHAPPEMRPLLQFRTPNIQSLSVAPCRSGFLAGIMPLDFGRELTELALWDFHPKATYDVDAVFTLLNMRPPLKSLKLCWDVDILDELEYGWNEYDLENCWDVHRRFLKALLAPNDRPAFPGLTTLELDWIPHDVSLTRLLRRVLRAYSTHGSLQTAIICLHCEETFPFMEQTHLSPTSSDSHQNITEVEDEYVASQLAHSRFRCDGGTRSGAISM